MSTQRRTRSASPLILILALALLVFGVAACSSGGEEPSAETATAAVEATSVPAEEAAPTVEPTPEVVAEAPAESAPTAAPVAEAATEAENASSASGTVTFVIDPAQSQARFYIDEVLLGAPKLVEGITNQVAGEVTVNLGDFTDIAFAPITIAADTFVTDSDRRNGAINRFILESSAYPTITFTPTGVENWPAEIAVGQPFSFDLVGDLTIREITSQETLAMTVTPVSESELSGSGSVTVLRETYDLTIPSVPSVADVSEEVLLEIDFVAAGE